jgi:excisionase family DNA binding protein
MEVAPQFSVEEAKSMKSDSKSIQPIPVKEALKQIPVSREFFYRAIKSGKLPSYRLGRRVLVDVDECLAAMRVEG